MRWVHGVIHGVMDPHSRSGQNHLVGSFPGEFQYPFGCPLDPDGITGLESGEAGGGSRGQLGLSGGPMNSMHGELEACRDLRKEWLESSANCWSLI